MVLLNRIGSCSTYPIKFLKYCISYLYKSNPSKNISPPVISYNLSIRLAIVVLPLPDSPIKAIFLPEINYKFIPSKINFLLLSEG